MVVLVCVYRVYRGVYSAVCLCHVSRHGPLPDTTADISHRTSGLLWPHPCVDSCIGQHTYTQKVLQLSKVGQINIDMSGSSIKFLPYIDITQE